jgi:6-phosphogluconolactonase
MNAMKGILALGALGAVALSPLVEASSEDNFATAHAVFVMNNDADANEVIAYQRTPYGTLFSPRKFKTGGRGSGGKGDPLGSQGSLTLSHDQRWLFAVNAGSGTLSVFRVEGSSLELTDRVPTGGAEPTAIAQNGDLVYVLNAAGSSSVAGFAFRWGHLTPIENSQKFLSANGANPGSVVFTPDGKFLLVTEKTGNDIDVFSVLPDGTLSAIKVNPSDGPGAFAVNVAPNGTAIVSETGSGGTTSAISSYSIHADGTLTSISTSIPTLGAANCWNAITPNGRFVYVSNAGSSTLSGFSIGSAGALSPIGATVVGTNPAGSGNLDVAISSDGRFLYSLNSAGGAIGAFAINADGSLVNLGVIRGLPAGASLNGIAAD